MNKTTKFILTGVATLGILGIGTAGAMAMTASLGVHDQAGTVQPISPVSTGSGSTPHSATPTPVPTGATTVPPAAPVYLDDHGGDRNGGSDDGATHDLGDDNGVDGVGHDVNDDNGGASSGSGSDDSGSGSSGSGHGGSDDGSGHN